MTEQQKTAIETETTAPKKRERKPASPKTLARKAERQGNVQRLEVNTDEHTGKKIPYVNHEKRARREAELLKSKQNKK